MAGPNINWDAVTEEATDILSRYIAIDTTNPPGNEAPAVRFLEKILRDNGIEDFTFYDASDDKYQGRLNMRAVLRGDGAKQPLVLLNHTDVVPVEREGWKEEPFAGLVKDGVIWGRGAVDMKGMGVMELMALLLMKRHGIASTRDVVFLACADEEAGSAYGAEFLAKHHPDALEGEYVINEGGWGTTEVMGVKRPVFNCAVSEKGPFWVRLYVEGRPGHGSVPHDNNSMDRLIRALNRVLDWQRPRSVVPELGEYFDRSYRNGLFPEEPTEEAIGRIAESNLLINAITTDTVSLTTMRAGVKHNVIPASAEATLDCRLLPGKDSQAFLAELRTVINDENVRIDTILDSNTPASPINTKLMSAIEQTVRDHVEDAVVLPSVSAGFTDSRVFRRLGVTSYGFIPVLLEPLEAITIHGHNERISVENLRLGCQMMFDLVRRICS
jgi:acetylornithine deacetylase/succinyl-diaminopimelate desuccinylase-like protein